MPIYLPVLNGSSSCSAVDDITALRPTHSHSFLLAMTLVDAFLCIIFICSIPVLYYLRNDARFSKIRPFSLSASLMVISIMYVNGCLLPDMITGFPCALHLFLHVFGSTAAVSVTSIRVLVFVIESQYALAISTDGLAVHQQQSDTVSTSSGDTTNNHSSVKHLKQKDGPLLALQQVIALGYGFRNIDNMSIDILSQIRRRYLFIFFAISLPPFLVYLISVLSIPAYRLGCADCGLTAEFVATVMATPTLNNILLFNLIRIGTRYKQDQQQVMRELILTMILAPIWIYIGYGLDLGDPSGLGFNRQFSWQILTCLGPFFFWFVIVFLQIIAAFKARRERARGSSRSGTDSITSSNIMEHLAMDPELKKEFVTYASMRYTQELLNFLEDVLAYKRHFEAANERWRKVNASKIVDTYIKLNASQQVNIGESQREAILGVNLETSPRLLNMFDNAYKDVAQMVTIGIWSDFTSMKRKNQKSAIIVATGA